MLRQLPDINSVLHGGAAGKADFIDGELPGRRNPIRWLVACGILLIAAIVIGTAVMVSNFRDHALESSKRELENTVLLLAHHFDQQLEDAAVPLNDIIVQIHQAGIDVSRRFQAADVHSRNAPDVEGQGWQCLQNRRLQYLRRRGSSDQFIGSAGRPERQRLPIALISRTLKSSPEEARLQIELVHSRFTGDWKTLIARKATGQHGEFLGIVSRAIRPRQNSKNSFPLVALGNDAAISMHHHDGTAAGALSSRRRDHRQELQGRSDVSGGGLPEHGSRHHAADQSCRRLGAAGFGSEPGSISAVCRSDDHGRFSACRLARANQIPGYRRCLSAIVVAGHSHA